jgi:predicted amidophosphoribosyltransferase
MATCTACGADVTGKKFCPECGTQVQQTPAVNAAPTSNVCPSCGGEVTPTASFCMHCGASLKAQSVASVPVSQVAAPLFCNNCGRQAPAGTRFCQHCGNALAATAPVAPPTAIAGGQYPQYPQQQYAQYQQSQQYPQQYPPQQYPQQYGQQGVGQAYAQYPQQAQQMVLRCPTCQAISAVGTQYCPGCRTSLVNVVPTPAYMAQQGQQSSLGGMLQGAGGNGMLMGALGGAAAVIGGEMLLHGLENGIANRVEGDMGYGYEHHRHHHHEEGLLGELGDVANDLGLF